MNQNQKVIAVLGATGYVGGRLVPSLLEKGCRCRAIGRSLDKLKSRSWANHPNIELVKADVSDKSSVTGALKGVHAAFYLVHSMNPSEKDYKEADRKAAENFRLAAEQNGLHQIIYLAGLGDDDDALSDHLKSRREVESILKAGNIPVTIFRAAMIIGSGSASFEILRYLVDRLPVMITPKWVNTPSQPIAIRNVLTYLMECLSQNETLGKTFDIGGPEILTYDELMRIYAIEAGLPRRLIIPVPVLTPRLSSYWIHLVTPVPASIAKPLAEGLKNPVICRNKDILKIIPQELLSAKEAMKRALKRTGDGDVDTSWTDAGRIPPVETISDGDPEWAGGTVYRDVRCMP
ncbi:MAG: NmrA family NAD(P)-binding protein, partial [Candidatus Omnitrophica bacterium]|nr:NmrA family NAD(P)-binding protein [Candidatus Omnitrophota bacterium]